MKAHELARKLLEGANSPLVISVACGKDTISSTDDDGDPLDDIVIIETTDIVRIEAWIEHAHFGWLD